MDRSRDIGALVKAVADARDAAENRLLRPYGITSVQMHVLLCLCDARDHRRTLKDLEKQLHVSQSTMAKVVKGLAENRGLVTYMTDPSDRRVRYVQLTEEARALCLEAEGIVNEMEHTLTKNLTEEETNTFRSYLEGAYKGVMEVEKQ